MRRRQGADRLPVALQRRRLYILPTRAGLAFAALVFVMLLAGLNYANSLALFLTFLLAGFGLVAMQQCHRNLLGAVVIAAEAPAVFAARPATADLTLGNPTAHAAPGHSRPRSTDAADRARRPCPRRACAPRRGAPAAAARRGAD